MSTKPKDQAHLLRAARQALELTNKELAAALGKSEACLTAWLSPRGAAKHRSMPDSSKLLLDRLLSDQPITKRASAKKKN